MGRPWERRMGTAYRNGRSMSRNKTIKELAEWESEEVSRSHGGAAQMVTRIGWVKCCHVGNRALGVNDCRLFQEDYPP